MACGASIFSGDLVLKLIDSHLGGFWIRGGGRSHFPSVVCYEIPFPFTLLEIIPINKISWNPSPMQSLKRMSPFPWVAYKKTPFPVVKDILNSNSQYWKLANPMERPPEARCLQANHTIRSFRIQSIYVSFVNRKRKNITKLFCIGLTV